MDLPEWDIDSPTIMGQMFRALADHPEVEKYWAQLAGGEKRLCQYFFMAGGFNVFQIVAAGTQSVGEASDQDKEAAKERFQEVMGNLGSEFQKWRGEEK